MLMPVFSPVDLWHWAVRHGHGLTLQPGLMMTMMIVIVILCCRIDSRHSGFSDWQSADWAISK